MQLPELFNDLMRKQLAVHAAWWPIANNFELGDYGMISNGIFNKIGNITADFGLSFDSKKSKSVKIDFTSVGTRIFKLNGEGKVVPTIRAGDINASLKIVFSKEKSFVVKSPDIQVTEISAIQRLAQQLSKLKGWRDKYKVVYKTCFALEAAILSSVEANTEITLGGEVSALNNLELGKAGLSLSSNKSLGLEFQGKQGIIGLGLFKVTNPLFGTPGIQITRGAKSTIKRTKSELIILDTLKIKDDL